MLKKIFIGLAAVVVSSAAFAHDGRGYDDDRYEHQERHEHRAERFEERWHRPAEHERAPRVAYVPQPVVTHPQGWASIDVHRPQ